MIEEKIIHSSKGDITLVTLTNSKGYSVTLSSLGAGIIEVKVPDREGKGEDVVLGYANAEDYFADGPCAGKCPGRYANRIAKGHLVIDGKVYQLPINNGPNHLHGGPDGFQSKIWAITNKTSDSVTFHYFSKDGEEGYPGNLDAYVKYTWTENNELQIEFLATVEGSPTVVNLTNHAYWNLKGHNSGSVLEHKLKLNAEAYLPTDDTLIPLGKFEEVEGTPMDFLDFKKLGENIAADFPAINFGKGYDNCWVIDNFHAGQLKEAAKLKEEESGRVLTVFTDQPGVQVYTGNWLAGSPKNKAGRSYNDYDGVAIECQDFPDSPNKPDFPSTLLKPGETYQRNIVFKFSTD